MICEHCGYELQIGDFPFCKGDAADHQGGSLNTVGDEIPGGVWIRHGICNEDGTPRKYYSHSAMRKEAQKRGWVKHVEHMPMPGSDKSPHTTRWV